MTTVLAQVASIAVLAFAVSSMMSVGFSYGIGQILAPLREIRAVFRALISNFVLVPLLAVALVRAFPMDPALALGLFLLAGSAGAPFLIKLASAARSDLALSAGLLVLLVPTTVVFLPFYVPLAMAHPALRGLSYVPSSVLSLGAPLLSTLLLPLLVGVAVKAAAPRWAARLAPIGGRVSTVAVLAVIVSTFGANAAALIRIVKSGAIVPGVLLVLGAFAVGYLLSRRERGAVLGLGTAQRNVAAALVIASRDFADPDVLVMVTACVVAGLVVLFPIAWLLGRQAPQVGLPTSEGAPA
jgi:predicted Na+-dependent transporter